MLGDVDGDPDQHEWTPLEAAIIGVLDTLEPGDVVTYGEVAAEAGYPGRARAVGRFLAHHGNGHPWWRVVNAAGRLVPGHEVEHAKRLADEGIPTADGRVLPSSR
jgi:methylated-DNA-protein-cysteine methyltransferase-like protein